MKKKFILVVTALVMALSSSVTCFAISEPVENTPTIQDKVVSWAMNIADDDRYEYYHFGEKGKCVKCVDWSKKCPLCYKKANKNGKWGWQCIGFVSAAYHHNGVKSVKCSMAGIGYDGSLERGNLTEWKNRNGKNWVKITNIPKNNYKKLQKGDILVCFNNKGKYQHVAIYAGDGMIVHARSINSGIVYGKINDKKNGTSNNIKYAMRYVDPGSATQVSKASN